MLVAFEGLARGLNNALPPLLLVGLRATTPRHSSVSCGSPRIVGNGTGRCGSRQRSSRGPGRSKLPVVSARCWPSRRERGGRGERSSRLPATCGSHRIQVNVSRPSPPASDPSKPRRARLAARERYAPDMGLRGMTVDVLKTDALVGRRSGWLSARKVMIGVVMMGVCGERGRRCGLVRCLQRHHALHTPRRVA